MVYTTRVPKQLTHDGTVRVPGMVVGAAIEVDVPVFGVSPPLLRTASATATELIREAIVEGRLEPGRRLKEVELAKELGISRTPIREALLLLQAEGLVEASPNRGSTVRAYDARELNDMYELRALLEGHSARRAAARITPETLAELRVSCARFEAIVTDLDRPGRLADLVSENGRFHELILAASGSDRLAGMVHQVVVTPLVYRSYVWYSPEQARLSFHAHVQLVNALDRHDADRSDAIMREHVFQARDVLLAHLGADEGG